MFGDPITQRPPSPTYMGTLSPSIYSHGDLTTEGPPSPYPHVDLTRGTQIPHPHVDLTTQGPPSPTHMGTLPPSIYSHGDLTTEGTPISLPTWGPYHRDPIPHPHGDLTTGTPHLPYPHVDLTTQGPHPTATWGPYHHPPTHMGTLLQRDPPISPTHMWTLPHRDPIHMGTLPQPPTHMGTLLQRDPHPPPTWTLPEGPTWGPYHHLSTHMGTSLQRDPPIPHPRGDLTTQGPPSSYPEPVANRVVDLRLKGLLVLFY